MFLGKSLPSVPISIEKFVLFTLSDFTGSEWDCCTEKTWQVVACNLKWKLMTCHQFGETTPFIMLMAAGCSSLFTTTHYSLLTTHSLIGMMLHSLAPFQFLIRAICLLNSEHVICMLVSSPCSSISICLIPSSRFYFIVWWLLIATDRCNGNGNGNGKTLDLYYKTNGSSPLSPVISFTILFLIIINNIINS